MDNHTSAQGRVSLSDVVGIVGVSTATVSRVLSHPDMVVAPTREAVAQALDRNGYRKNHVARTLRRGRTGCMVALVPNLGSPFFVKIRAGMGRELAAAGYDLHQAHLAGRRAQAQGPRLTLVPGDFSLHAGQRAPREVSVVGFDVIELARMARPGRWCRPPPPAMWSPPSPGWNRS